MTPPRPRELSVAARPLTRAALTRGPALLALVVTSVWGSTVTDTTPPGIAMYLGAR